MLVDCTMNTSLPRTLSCNSTRVSPSEKQLTSALPRGLDRFAATSSASCLFAFPLKIKNSDIGCRPYFLKSPKRFELWLGRQDSNLRMLESKSSVLSHLTTPQRPIAFDLTLAGAAGFEPANAGIKSSVLGHLTPHLMRKQQSRVEAKHLLFCPCLVKG